MFTKPHSYDKVVYLLQGGGALGAYQVGVCEGLLENNRTPDWIIGTSIGAINGAIIAGNKPEKRVENLKKFWNMITSPASEFLFPTTDEKTREFHNFWVSQWTLLYGQPGFFTPRMINPCFDFFDSADKLSFYDTTELQETLKTVIDFDLINQGSVRLTLGAVSVEEGAAVNFDTAYQEIKIEHVMASCAFPPGFPAVKINEKYYWDGGISSNTPLNVVLEENSPCKILCFMVNLFAYREEAPKSILDVFKRIKDLEYGGRHREIFKYFCERHRLQLAIHKLLEQNPQDKDNPLLKDIIPFGRPSTLNLIRFHYKDRPYDLWSKDFEFSKQSIQEHYQMGYNDFQKVLKKPEWFEVIDDDLIVINEL